MAISLIYSEALYAQATGGLDFAGGGFRVMLVDATYSPDRDGHRSRADVTGEIAGKGYAAGGQDVAVGAASVEGGVDISLGGAVWPRATFTAAGAVYYRARGGDGGADELVAFIAFAEPVRATNGDWRLEASAMRQREAMA